MLENKTIQDPTAVEEIFCKGFDKIPFNVPMDKLEMQMMMNALQFEEGLIEADPFANLSEEEEKELPFAVKMVKQSIKTRFTFEMTDCMQVLVAIIAKSAGTCVMYLTYLQYRAKKLGVKEITAMEFAQNIFPMGLPSEENLQKLWYSQKVNTKDGIGGSDNLLDYQSALVSIQYLDNVK
jgi:hypothetical protein